VDQYFVVSADGTEYGPTDRAGLTQWTREGRILPQTLVRAGDAAPVPAATLPELATFFATPPAPIVSPPFPTTVAIAAEFRSWQFIGQAWDLVKPHWLPLAAMSLITFVIGAVPYVGPCVAFLIGGAIGVGINRAILGLLAGRAPDVGMMFNGFDRFGPAFLANLVIMIGVAAGMLLCIVPGIILALMWVFTSLVLAETSLDFWPAMKASADLTAGYRWPLFCLLLACILVALAGLLVCSVGIFVAQPVILTAIALAYRFLQAKKAQPASA
jgi:uncharacterized membrane protein